MIESLPRFPKPKEQRDVAGRHYLGKAEINSLYFATHELKRPRGWSHPFAVGRYWRSALVIFFNYGLDTGTVWKTEPFHEPILWRHVRTIPYSMEEERGQTIASGHFAASRESNSKPVLRAVMSKSGYSRISARHAQRITTNMSRSHLSRSLAIPWQESPIVTTPIARRWRSRPS